MHHRIRKALMGVAALGALALGGSAIAGAATSSGPSTTTTSGTAAPPAPANFPAHGTAAHEDAEKAVTGDAATKAQAAAVKSAGGGKAGAVTADFTGNGFEVTVTKTQMMGMGLGDVARMAPLALMTSQRIRMQRKWPKAIYKEDLGQIILPMTKGEDPAEQLIAFLSAMVPAEDGSLESAAP